MKIEDSGQHNSLKRPYRKPTVDSRGLELGVYGDYGRDPNSHGDGTNGPGASQGHPVRDSHRQGQGL